MHIHTHMQYIHTYTHTVIHLSACSCHQPGASQQRLDHFHGFYHGVLVVAVAAAAAVAADPTIAAAA